MRQLIAIALLTTVLAAASVLAQSATQADPAADPMASMWNPQMMIERSVKQAAKRYNLTPEQEQIALKMTTTGVNEFLDAHEQDIRSLVRQVIQIRFSGQTPTPEQAKAWSEKAYPLFEEAKKAIVDGNQKFRSHLTEEQRKVFDVDQKTMAKQFDLSRDTLGRWKEGGFDPANDWANRVRPQNHEDRSPRPELDRFERYARRFIDNYKLDAAQASQVMAIVAQSRKRAEEHWYSHKVDMQAMRDRVQELSRDPSKRQEYLLATRQLAEINKPVNALYDEMRERVDLIPTEAQREAYESKAQARRQAWRDKMHRSGHTAVSATSQTSSSQQVLADDDDLEMDRPVTTRSATSRRVTTRPVVEKIVK